MNNDKAANMGIYEEILGWSQELPIWQRDALRRLLRKQDLPPDEVESLFALCKQPHGLVESGGSALSALPLATGDLPTSSSSVEAVRIRSLNSLKNVNALRPGQRLDLETAGLTIVYGDNGAGKTGYARILKQACRSRGSSVAIVPNVFSAAGSVPEACIDYSEGTRDASFAWRPTATPPGQLSRVSVFDSFSARVYVGQSTDVPYLPAGLDLLSGLAQLSQTLQTRLKQELEAVKKQKRELAVFSAGTPQAEFLRTLSSSTDKAELARLAEWQAVDDESLATTNRRLVELLATDPEKKRAEIRNKIARLTRLSGRVRNIVQILGDEALGQLDSLHEAWRTRAQAAQLASHVLFKDEPLPDVGCEAWKALWEAARRYSTQHAYKKESFPVVTDGARCVLCQQLLESAARARLVGFESFVTAEADRLARAAAEQLAKAVKAIDACQVDEPDDAVNLSELKADSTEAESALAAFLSSAKSRREYLVRLAGQQEIPLDIQSCPKLSDNPVQKIEIVVVALEAVAAQLEGASIADQKAIVEKELRLLAGRKRLHECLPDVLAEVDRMVKEKAYSSALADVDTAGISRKSSQLTKKAVTDEMVRTFEQTVGELDAASAGIRLKAKGAQRGAFHHQVGLDVPKAVDVEAVVSEGEHRAIALAAFLTEVSIASDPSCIIFDDPVSSLDHLRREAVARRLTQEAKNRQVIVFTHDIVFVLLLVAAGEELQVPHATWTVQRMGTEPGACSQGLPWEGKSAKSKVAYLKDQVIFIKKDFADKPQDEYDAIAKQWYSKLRDAWEKSVEDVFFRGAVVRFRRSIETKKIAKIDVIDSDYLEIANGMSKCSRFVHDQAVALGVNRAPNPNEIEQDLLALESWISRVMKRRGD